MTGAHAATTALLAAASSSTTTTTSGNALETLLPLILIFGLVYFFLLRPRAQAARRQRDTLMELSAGDEVLTGAGIFGTVLDVEPDRVTLETAPGTRITVVRSTIARKITQPTVLDAEWDEQDEDEARDAYHDYEHGHDEPHDEAGDDDDHEDEGGETDAGSHGDHPADESEDAHDRDEHGSGSGERGTA